VPKLRGRSILMNEEASTNNDFVLNLGDSDKQQYQQKLMLINEQVIIDQLTKKPN
jgi:hypothetical protein